MKRRRKFPIFTLFVVFLLVMAGVVLFLTISGHPASPFISYQVTYDDSLTEEEKTKLQKQLKKQYNLLNNILIASFLLCLLRRYNNDIPLLWQGRPRG